MAKKIQAAVKPATQAALPIPTNAGKGTNIINAVTRVNLNSVIAAKQESLAAAQ